MFEQRKLLSAEMSGIIIQCLFLPSSFQPSFPQVPTTSAEDSQSASPYKLIYKHFSISSVSYINMADRDYAAGIDPKRRSTVFLSFTKGLKSIVDWKTAPDLASDLWREPLDPQTVQELVEEDAVQENDPPVAADTTVRTVPSYGEVGGAVWDGSLQEDPRQFTPAVHQQNSAVFIRQRQSRVDDAEYVYSGSDLYLHNDSSNVTSTALQQQHQHSSYQGTNPNNDAMTHPQHSPSLSHHTPSPLHPSLTPPHGHSFFPSYTPPPSASPHPLLPSFTDQRTHAAPPLTRRKARIGGFKTYFQLRCRLWKGRVAALPGSLKKKAGGVVEGVEGWWEGVRCVVGGWEGWVGERVKELGRGRGRGKGKGGEVTFRMPYER